MSGVVSLEFVSFFEIFSIIAIDWATKEATSFELSGKRTMVDSLAIFSFASIAFDAKSNCTAFWPALELAASPITTKAFAFASATAISASASPWASKIFSSLSASADNTTAALSPSALLIAACRSPSDSNICALLTLSALICFSIASITDCGGSISLIS